MVQLGVGGSLDTMPGSSYPTRLVCELPDITFIMGVVV